MPPKKGKGKKKAPLTEEQKKKQAEQKALAEKEKLVRRRELTKAFLTLKKDKEYELLKLNEKKILDMWRPKLRETKIQELLQDYKLMQHAFERVFNRKTNLIQEVENTLEKTEGEYDHAVDMHMYNIDKMMEFYQKRVKEIRETFMTSRKLLLERLNDEKRRIRDHHKKSLQFITDRMDATKKQFSDMDADSKMELMMREEDLKNNEMQEMHVFKTTMDEKINKLWQIIQERIINFEQVTSEKRKEFIKLRDRDLKLAELIDIQFAKHAILTNGIGQLDKRTLLFQKTYDNYIEDLKEKKIECRGIYNELMMRRRLLLTSSREKLGVLAVSSRDIIDKMDGMLEKREKVMKATERCRRREQLQEKVDPFLTRFAIPPFVDEDVDEGVESEGKTMTTKLSSAGFDRKSMDANSLLYFRVHGPIHNMDCECDPCTCELVGEGGMKLSAPINALINDYALLEKFWLRFNKVSLDKGALLQQKRSLAADNFNLKVALRNYMGGLNPTALNAGKFSEQIMEENRNDVRRILKILRAEQKRKERCRKIGGLRVH